MSTEWMGIRIEAPAPLIREVMRVLEDHGLKEIDWCYLGRGEDLAWADYYPTEPRAASHLGTTPAATPGEES